MSTIRSRLLLLVFAALLPGVTAAALMTVGPREGALAAVVLLTLLATIGALLAARHIAREVETLTEVSVAMRSERSAFERQASDAAGRIREAEQQAAQAQAAALLGRLSGGISHDFNNVLGVISNCAHLLQRSADDAVIGPPVATMLRAVDFGSRLTDQLQRMAARAPVRSQPLSLGSLFADVQEQAAVLLGQRIRIDVEVAPGTAPVMADASELELVLLNLSLNAREAMPRGGGVRLRARLADDAEAGGLASPCVLIRVSGEAASIDARGASRTFDPFFSAPGDGAMAGFGMSQVRGFCVRAGGTARVAATPELGTVVMLLLPAASPRAPSNRPDAAGDGQHDAGDVAGADR